MGVVCAQEGFKLAKEGACMSKDVEVSLARPCVWDSDQATGLGSPTPGGNDWQDWNCCAVA